MVIHQATASSVWKMNNPTHIPVTLMIEENTPHRNRLLVSLDAWKIEPEVDMMICIPTEMDNIWNNIKNDFYIKKPISQYTIRVISRAENQRKTDNGNPMKASKRMIFSYALAR